MGSLPLLSPDLPTRSDPSPSSPFPGSQEACRQGGEEGGSLSPLLQLAVGCRGSMASRCQAAPWAGSRWSHTKLTLRGLGLILCWVNLKFVIISFIAIFEQRGSAFSFCPEPHKLCSWSRGRPVLPTHPSLSGPSALHSHTQ